jgi:hypothetical protein
MLTTNKLTADGVTAGVLVNKVTTTEKTAISTALGATAEGMVVWDTTLKSLYTYNGTTWVASPGTTSGTITGSGTAGTIPKFITATSVGDSIGLITTIGRTGPPSATYNMLDVTGALGFDRLTIGGYSEYTFDLRPTLETGANREPIFIAPIYPTSSYGQAMRFNWNPASATVTGEIGAIQVDFTTNPPTSGIVDMIKGSVSSTNGAGMWGLDFHCIRTSGTQSSMYVCELELTTNSALTTAPNSAIGIYTQGSVKSGIAIDISNSAGGTGTGWNWILNHRSAWGSSPSAYPTYSGIDGDGYAYFRRVKITDASTYGNAAATDFFNLTGSNQYPTLVIGSSATDGGGQLHLQDGTSNGWSIYNLGSANELHFYDFTATAGDRVVYTHTAIKHLLNTYLTVSTYADHAAAVAALGVGYVYRKTGEDYLSITHA